VAENFLELILKHRQAVDQSFALTKADRCAFELALEPCSIVDRVYPSGANFLLVRLTLDLAAADALVTRLMNVELVHLKDVSGKVGDGRAYLRVAVRTPDENMRLCHLLEAAVAHV
jgi:histidinol-phosphate/aromatic aminotransferase/cobyric acid decarboxylase-like protein